MSTSVMWCGWRRWKSWKELQDLLGKVLAEGTFRLIRRGLDRGYREVREDLAGIRGKIALGETATRAL